jgi:hypothetical protein
MNLNTPLYCGDPGGGGAASYSCSQPSYPQGGSIKETLSPFAILAARAAHPSTIPPAVDPQLV